MLSRDREQDKILNEKRNLESIYETLFQTQNQLQQESSQSANSTCFTTTSSSMSFDESSILHEGEFTNEDLKLPSLLQKKEPGRISLHNLIEPPQNPMQNVFTESLLEFSSDPVIDTQITAQEVTRHSSQTNKSSLMALLSGNQKSKKIKPKVRSNDNIERGQDLQGSSEEKEAEVNEDWMPCVDDSFTESKSNDLRKEHEMIELEKKFYNNAKSVTPKDFLAQLNQMSPIIKAQESDNSDQPKSFFIDENGEKEPVVIELDSDDNKNEIELLESKVFSNVAKRTTAKDIFQSFKPSPYVVTGSKQKSANNIKSSYVVSLKLNPLHLREVQKTTNPFFTKGNKKMAPSLVEAKSYLETIMQNSNAKKKALVTLKVDPEKLRGVTKSLYNPLFSRGTIGTKGKSSSTLFKAMMENASANSSKLSSLQALKELHPPALSREMFHVCPVDDIQESKTKSSTLAKLSKLRTHLNRSEVESPEDRSMLLNVTHVKPILNRYKVEYKKFPNKEILLEYVLSIIPSIKQEPPFMKIYNQFLETSTGCKKKESILWTNLFQPQQITDVLISPSKQKDIRTWILNSFARLKSQALKTPRNVLIKQQKRQKKNNCGGLYDFIVDDYDTHDGSETEEDIFVPLLIVQGPVGSCKSSSIYAALNEINGYVYEINSGQPRGKKDILGTLKEMCTTHLVHRQNDGKEFQKGVVLLEDCDVLFEQDKNFWLAVQEVLNISRRPLIITCNDIRAIPQSIIEFAKDEDAIINLVEDNYRNSSTLKGYLQLCCISQGYQIDEQVLEDILRETCGESYDLRKALTACQMLCQKYPLDLNERVNHEVVLRTISYKSKQKAVINEELSLDQITNNIDLLSISDVISSNSHSLINHNVIPNELLDIPFIDESTRLKQNTLPYELNIGDYIKETSMFEKEDSINRVSFNNIREATTTFVSSRSRQMPKLIQDVYSMRSVRASTRSMTDSSENLGGWERDTTGVPDTSICNILSRSAYILEFAPYVRQWCHYQNSLDVVEAETLNKLGVSVKKFIGWRQFQDNSKTVLNTFI